MPAKRNYDHFIGQKNGSLICISWERKQHDGYNAAFLNCLCECGNSRLVPPSSFKWTKNCGCGASGEQDYRHLIGEKREKATCIGIADRRVSKINPNRTTPYLLIRCDCGNEYEMIVSRFGEEKNCSKCKRGENLYNYKHDGAQRTPRLYRIWHLMKRRCNGKSERHRRWYLEKGITVCDQWTNDFIPFRDWALSNGYADNLTIDRRDGDKGYSPENCRWITQKEQTRNTKSRRNIIYKGLSLCWGEWEELVEEKTGRLKSRFYDKKYPKTVEQILVQYEDKINAYIADNPHKLMEQDVPYK